MVLNHDNKIKSLAQQLSENIDKPVAVRLYPRDRAYLVMIANHLHVNQLVDGKVTVSKAIRYAIEMAGESVRMRLAKGVMNV